MNLKYITADKLIILDLDTGMNIPAAPGNRHYDEIVAKKLPIADPDPEPAPADPVPDVTAQLMIDKGHFTLEDWVAKFKE